MEFPMRLNRYLSACGLGSRRGCEALITEGRVKINDRVCLNLGTKVAASDKVAVNGRPVRLSHDVVIALHKPVGYVCTRADERDRRTIYDLLPPQLKALHHVGRLDLDSSGLILLTNRGELSHKLTHPGHGVEKEYEVTLEEPFDDAKIGRLVKGMLTPEGHAKAERAWVIGHYKIGMVLRQGLKRQIRHMLYQLGYEVKRLERVRIGNILLKGMPEGAWRELDAREVERLIESADSRSRSTRSLPPSRTSVRPAATEAERRPRAGRERRDPGED